MLFLFTIGDNDTFPLWYAQEIEGTCEPDMKNCKHTIYFMTDWYIDQQKNAKLMTSDGLPISFTTR
jgi:hypothetical protein